MLVIESHPIGIQLKSYQHEGEDKNDNEYGDIWDVLQSLPDRRHQILEVFPDLANSKYSRESEDPESSDGTTASLWIDSRVIEDDVNCAYNDNTQIKPIVSIHEIVMETLS